MNLKISRSGNYLALLAFLALVLFFLPLPQAAEHTGQVQPYHEYQIISNGNGSYTTIEKNVWINQVMGSRHLSTDRDGLLTYRLNPDLAARSLIQEGDTLAWFSSTTLEEESISLQGELQTLQATLAYERSGSRETEIEAARQRLSYARTRHEEQQKVLQRSADLFKKNFISQQEYDQDVSREQLDAIRVSIAEADLASALTGAPVTRLAVIRSQIAEVQRKLALHQEIVASLTLTSPLTGQPFFPFGADTLLSVAQMDTVVVMIPVPLEALGSAVWSTDLRIQTPAAQIQVAPDQIQHGEQIWTTGRNQMILFRARISNPEGHLLQGQRVQVTLDRQAKSVFQILRESF